jgi:hypothetical protein
MIVIAIMAIVMTMSAPAIYHIYHKESLRKAVADIMEACARARAKAIMSGTIAELVFHSEDNRFEVAGGAAPARKESDDSTPVEVSAPPPANSGLSGVIPDSVAIAVLKINGVNYIEGVDTYVARVRFYPNGTCDELRLVLLDQSGEMRGIFLEITTSLASVESDRFKLQDELR